MKTLINKRTKNAHKHYLKLYYFSNYKVNQIKKSNELNIFNTQVDYQKEKSRHTRCK